MKQKDVAVIIIVVVLSAITSYLISSRLFTSPKDLSEEVEVVEPIKAEMPTADPRYFNVNSINPTEEITIGNGQN